MQSSTKTLTHEDIYDWLINLRTFFIPLALMYLLPISVLITTPDHTITLQDFAINSVVLGAMIKYVMDAAIGLLRKYYQGN